MFVDVNLFCFLMMTMCRSYSLRRVGGTARSALAGGRLACKSNVQPAAAGGEVNVSDWFRLDYINIIHSQCCWDYFMKVIQLQMN